MKSSMKKAILESMAFIALLLLVFALWFEYGGWIDGHVKGFPAAEQKTNDLEARGLYGDKFGAVNALFSGLAFAGIIFTIFLQRRDLSQSNYTAKSQRFDETFFQLISLHNDITSKLRDIEDGRQAFTAFNAQLRLNGAYYPLYAALAKIKPEEVRAIRDSKVPPQGDDRLTAEDMSNIATALAKGAAGFDNFLDGNQDMHERILVGAYTNAAKDHIDNFSHYFRNLYHLLRFVKNTELIEAAEKDLYVKIIRSQLSEPELVALFYNSAAPIKLPGREAMELGCPKMGRLLAEFDILQNMSPRSIFHPIHYSIFKKNNGVLP